MTEDIIAIEHVLGAFVQRYTVCMEFVLQSNSKTDIISVETVLQLNLHMFLVFLKSIFIRKVHNTYN